MVVITRYTLILDTKEGIYTVKSNEALKCPDCGGTLSGYDRRRRFAISSDGQRHTYKIRRLRCRCCGKLHLEFPDFLLPYKHYEATVIAEVQQGEGEYCPADDSTIRRWRK